MKSSTISRDDIDSVSRAEYDRRQNEQYDVFEILRVRVFELLKRFGRPDFMPGQRHGDFSVHGDYSEDPQVVVFRYSEVLRGQLIFYGVAVLIGGRLRQVDETAVVFRAPVSEEVARFVGVETIVMGQVIAVGQGTVTVDVAGCSLEIAADICVYTNRNLTILEL